MLSAANAAKTMATALHTIRIWAAPHVPSLIETRLSFLKVWVQFRLKLELRALSVIFLNVSSWSWFAQTFQWKAPEFDMTKDPILAPEFNNLSACQWQDKKSDKAHRYQEDISEEPNVLSKQKLAYVESPTAACHQFDNFQILLEERPSHEG